MQGLWRYLVLMFAPALVGGGYFINGLWRIWDAPGEPLMVLLGAVAAGGVCFAVNARIARRFPCLFPRAATVDLVVVAALLLIPGLIQRVHLPGPWMGGAAMLIVSAGAAWLLHGWPMLSGSDRNWRGIGLLGALCLYWYFIRILRLHFVEPILFWGGETMLFFWLLASPLTARGSRKHRWMMRGVILAILFIAPLVRPQYLYAPWFARPECMPENAVWSGTDVLANGSYFSWKVPTEKEKDIVFDARGRMVKAAYPDGDMIPAIPGLLGICGTSTPRILLAAGQYTVWANAACDSGPEVHVHWIPTPYSLGSALPERSPGLKQSTLEQLILYPRFSMLVMLAVPEYPAFEGGLVRWLEVVTTRLRKNAAVAVPARLLKSPTLMRYFLDRYAWHGVLPGPGEIWIFSDRPRDLSPAAIDRSLNALFGDASPLPRGMYELMYTKLLPPETVSTEPVLHLSADRWHAMRSGTGSVSHWFWGGILVLAIWRLVRLFAERKGTGYRNWNLVENTFSITAGYLAWMAFLISDFNIAAGNVFVYSLLPVALLISHWRSWISWTILAVCAWHCINQGVSLPGATCLVVFAVNAWLGSLYALKTIGEPKVFREELPAWGAGVLLGALAIGAAVWLEAQIEAVVLLLIVARLPILWQLKLVYYKRKQELK